MKKLIALVLAVVCVTSLVGCTTTYEYRLYQSFAERHKAGMEKQKVLEKLGCPDRYIDAQGNYQSIKRADRESFKKTLSSDRSTVWFYDCYQFSDPANPCILKITFNDEGKSVRAEFDFVPGG